MRGASATKISHVFLPFNQTTHLLRLLPIRVGAGVMMDAGIFALTGQIAELDWPPFSLSVVIGASGIVK